LEQRLDVPVPDPRFTGPEPMTEPPAET
jgi:hypothetical protein